MRCPGLNELPPPPPGKTGWPWTVESDRPDETAPDGAPWPRISIVTPSFNQGQYVEESIRSVLLQGYSDLQLIVIDGGSTDGSVEVIRKYSPWIAYSLSEADRGQSHAINKGLARCDGEIFNWLNTDDLLFPAALATVGRAWKEDPGRVVAGGLEFLQPDGSRRQAFSAKLTLENFIRWRQAYGWGYAYFQPATFMPLQAVRQAGGIREDLHLVMDHFLMIELLKGCRVAYVPQVLACFRQHGRSKTQSAGGRQFDLEIIRNLRKLKSLPVDVSGRWLRREHGAIHFRCAERCARAGEYPSAVGHVLAAMRHSFGRTIGRLRKKRLLRGLGRMMLHVLRLRGC